MAKAVGLINYSTVCTIVIRRAQEYAYCCPGIAVIVFQVDTALLGISSKNKVCGSKGKAMFEVFHNLCK